MATAHAAIDDSARAERELSNALNHAIAETEDEIFKDAMGEEPLDNDADTSLEEMGEGLEGEPLDDEIVGDTEDAEQDARARIANAPDGEDQQGPQARESAQADGTRESRQPGDEQTPWREQLAALQSQLETRFNDLLARLANAQPQRPPQEQPAARPDLMSQPEAYEKWVRENATREALAAVRHEQYLTHQNGVDRNFAQAMQSERGFEFYPAYQALMSLDRNIPQNRQMMETVYYASDPAAALFQWWDATIGPQYRAAAAQSALSRLSPEVREDVLAQIAPRSVQRQQGARAQARHEFRPAQALPSLNSATGSNVHRTGDPDLFDNSDSSVFAFATR